jgi:hypothetical protein
MIPDIVCSPSHSTCDSADVNTFIIPRIVKKILDNPTLNVGQMCPLAVVNRRGGMLRSIRRCNTRRGCHLIIGSPPEGVRLSNMFSAHADHHKKD